MRTIGGKSKAQRRSARWQVKKHDDTLIARWAGACSREHGDCRGCEFTENCQDLADRLIGCMEVPLTGQYKHATYGLPQRHPAGHRGVSPDSDPRQDPLCVQAAALR
jgi:hypothetical protein